MGDGDECPFLPRSLQFLQDAIVTILVQDWALSGIRKQEGFYITELFFTCRALRELPFLLYQANEKNKRRPLTRDGLIPVVLAASASC